MMLRKTLLGFLLVAMGAMTSACWFSSPSASALIGRATDRALDSDSVSFELEVALEGDIAAEDLDYAGVRAHGAIDREAERSVFVFGTAGLELEVRTIDDFAYIRLSDGDGWTKMEAGEFLELGDLFGPLFDPYAILEDLGLDPVDVRDEGEDVVRGKPARRYSVDVPAREYDDTVEDFLPVNGDSTIRFWIGEDGLPARIIIESRGDGDDFDVNANGEVVARLTVDLFDYGKRVEFEAPPADEIVDLPSFAGTGSGSGSFENPFEGAECYGDRIDECLGVNPEVDAMAQGPGTCSGLDVRVCLVPVGFVRADIVKAIVDFHKETANIDVVVLPSVAIPPAVVDRHNSQMTTEDLYALVKAAYPAAELMRSTFIGMSPIDTRSEDFGWVFGTRYGMSAFGHVNGVFSYFRMLHVEPYDGSGITEALIHERVAKYTARYTALLHLKYPMTEDSDFLNYYEMYGFGDLDAMGPKWPEGTPPCLGPRQVVCVVGDGEFSHPAFASDAEAAVHRIAAETGLPVEFRGMTEGGTIYYVPTKPDWGTEFAGDLATVVTAQIYASQVPIVGVTDDNLAQDSSVPPGIDRWFGDIQMSIISGYGAGTPGTAAHQERIYRLLLRGVLVAQFGMELNDDPGSLMFRGITTPAELDGKMIPAIPTVD